MFQQGVQRQGNPQDKGLGFLIKSEQICEILLSDLKNLRMN
jgi:hypothetical protein